MRGDDSLHLASMDVSRLTRSPLQSVWPNEAFDFTPWLAEHLDWLAEDLGFGALNLEGTEVTIPGGRSLDILASDELGRLVAIENQFRTVDHDHLTRGLAYAVGLNATDRTVSALIVIAEGHRDEFVAVVDYLNECADARGEKGIHVFLVEAETVRIDESSPAVQFKVVAGPNEWEGAIRSARTANLPSATEILAQLDPDDAEKAQRILDYWESRDNTFFLPATNSIALFARNTHAANKRVHVGAIELNHGGVFMCAPGRLSDTGRVTQDDLDTFESLLGALPPTVSKGAGYFQSFLLSELQTDDAIAVLSFAANLFN